MAIFLAASKNKIDLNKKTSVYFTCHPEDFEKYFSMVCEHIFKAKDCSIWRTPTMTDPITEEEFENELGRVNLFVVPVTHALLTTPNRAMDVDVPYAKKAHIPILPLMMEPGLDALYAKPDKFAALQYLTPFQDDVTALSYEEKLKKHLESILGDEKQMQLVRQVFDAYIFLSYRKSDRKLANDLMRSIHSHPQYRNIAIWFDEFLIPGRNFITDIYQHLVNSKLFLLVVTPNLLNTPNFVADEEYPAAKNLNLAILPVEMADTDQSVLESLYQDLPPCRTLSDIAFETLLHNLSAQQDKRTPEHRYLMGLAYLNGVDVEKNGEYALDYLTSAAEDGYGLAMHELYNMYNYGHGVALDYEKAIFWHKKYANFIIDTFGAESPTAIYVQENLSYTYTSAGQYQNAWDILDRLYPLACRVFGEHHEDTLNILIDLATAYDYTGQYNKALELRAKLYDACLQILGAEHPTAIDALSGLGQSYSRMCQYDKSLEIAEQVYQLRCKVLGDLHPSTITSLNNVAMAHSELGNLQKALELEQQVYEMRCKILGPEHPNTIFALDNIGTIYIKCHQDKQAQEAFEQAYQLYSRTLGEEHPDALRARCGIALGHSRLGDDEKAIEILQEIYAAHCKVLGQNHPETLIVLSNMAMAHMRLGHMEEYFKLGQVLFSARCNILGANHPLSILSFQRIENALWNAQRLTETTALYEKLYNAHMGNHSTAIELLDTIMYLCNMQKDYPQCMKTADRIYVHKKAILGPEHPDTWEALRNVCTWAEMAGDYLRVAEIMEVEYLRYLGETGECAWNSHKLRDVADSYRKAGMFEKAIALYQRSMDLCQAEERLSDVAFAEEGIANTYKDMGAYEEALALYKKVCYFSYEHYEGAYWAIHGILMSIVECCEKLENFPQAEEVRRYMQGQCAHPSPEPESYEDLLDSVAKVFPTD